AKIGAAVSQERNLFEKVNEVIAPLKTGIVVNSIESIDAVLTQIKKPSSIKHVAELQFLESTDKTLSTLKGEIGFIDEEYQKYFVEFKKIAEDVQSIMQTFLVELLKSGESILVKKFHQEESCPLCLQPINVKELKNDIQRRLKEIEESSKKKAGFDIAKRTVTNIVSERLKRLEHIENDILLKE